MKTKLQKYTAYKDSGVEWLGEIPEGWALLSNKNIFNLKKNQVGKKSADYVLLSLTLKGIIIRVLEDGGKFPAEFDTYQEVKKGDFVFCLFDVEETPRCVGLSDYEGMITGAYTVMGVKPNFEKKFLYYFYLNLDADKRMKPLYTGLRNTISKDNFFAFKAFVPPLPEQTSIAAFLDDKTAKLDRVIAQKQQMIALLKERKQIIIQNAVTGQLKMDNGQWIMRPKSEMKDSGVEWIGEIPEGWEILYNRRLFRENNRKVTKLDELPLSLSQVDGVVPSDEMKERSLSPSHRSNFKICMPNDLVVNRFKGHLGVFFRSSYRGIVTFHYGVFEPNNFVNTKYYELLYHTDPYKVIYAGASNGMTIGLQNLSNQNFYDVKSIVPPIEEQNIIVDYCSDIEKKVQKAITTQLCQIDKLKEYKATLIDSAVTGKIKVG